MCLHKLSFQSTLLSVIWETTKQLEMWQLVAQQNEATYLVCCCRCTMANKGHLKRWDVLPNVPGRVCRNNVKIKDLITIFFSPSCFLLSRFASIYFYFYLSFSIHSLSPLSLPLSFTSSFPTLWRSFSLLPLTILFALSQSISVEPWL